MKSTTVFSFFLITMLMVSTPVLAQEENNNNTEEETIEEPDNNGEDNNETSLIQITDTLEIIDTEWDGEMVTITFRSNVPQQVTLTDVNSMDTSGVSEVNFRSLTVSAGITEVEMETTARHGDRTVAVASGENMVSVSNPRQPLLEDVDETDLYIFGILVAATIPFQIIIRRIFDAVQLKRRLVRFV